MELARRSFLMTAKVFLLLVGFGLGLGAGLGDPNSPTIAEGIISAVLTILFLPPMVVMLFRVEVAIGIFKPPWETPSGSSTMNPLSAVQLGSLVFTAMGVGSTVAIPWRGFAALSYALIGLSGGIGLHLALVRLMKRFPPNQTNTQDSDSGSG
jgi:hypothetical protein